MKRDESAVILIVDDKPANVVALEALLATENRFVLSADSGEAALKIALRQEIDLIILDVQMPGMNGFELAQLLKSNRKTRDIPIIFASAEKKEHASIMKGFGEGAIDYLFKPLDADVTKAKVNVLLEVQIQKKQLVEKNALLEKAALLINNSADIIGIIDRATLRIEEVNAAFTEILGYPREEILSTSILNYLDDEESGLVDRMAEAESEKASFETRIYCKNRAIKWLAWNVVIKDGKWFVNARDITEIKQAGRIRNYLATVVKQSSDAIYIHDGEGSIISWNEGAERTYGYTESEALKMKIWNIVPDDLQPKMEEILSTLLKGKKVEFMESKRLTKNGKLIDVLFSASLISPLDTCDNSIVITERDVTSEKIAVKQIRDLNATLERNVIQLEETNKELESFSYSVSHDLRAPLRALQGNASILEEDHGDNLNDEARKYIQKIHSNVSRMNGLINDLLAFSKIGKKELKKTLVDMNALVHTNFAEIGQLSADDASLTIGDLPQVYGDYALLNQVWANLISNAIKYSSKKENPRIEVGARDMNGDVEYFIKDNGAGFDMRYAERLFGTFQRLHDLSEFDGTGIGLAIVKRIILKHGGTIRAHAEPEKGATFYFTLPRTSQ